MKTAVLVEDEKGDHEGHPSRKCRKAVSLPEEDDGAVRRVKRHATFLPPDSQMSTISTIVGAIDNS